MLNHLRRLTSVAPALLLLAGCGSGNEFTPLSATGRSTSTSNPGSSSSSSSSGSSSSSSSSSGGSATDQTFLFATTGLAAGQNFVWNLSYNNSVVASSSVNSNGTSSILAPPVTGTENFEFTVTQQPTGQTCTVTNNSGSVSSSLVPQR